MKRWLIAAVLLAGSTVVAQAPPVVPGPRSIPAPPGVRFIQGSPPAITAVAQVPRKFRRGAKSSRHHWLAYQAAGHPQFAHQAKAVPASFAPSVVLTMAQMSYWLNDSDGDCVTAEECAAIDVLPVWYNPSGLASRVVMTDATVQQWASSHGYLNGANLTDVMDSMASDGMAQGGTTYHDGPYTSVDYTTWATLCSAIYQGPVKIGIASSQLDGTQAGNQNGWIATGFRSDNSEDHCVGLWGYGTMTELCSAMNVTPPASAAQYTQCLLLYTWDTIGIIDFASMNNITGEAWLRTPTDLQITPAPLPGPTPPPTPAGLAWALVNPPSGATLDQDGNFTWTIPATQAVDNVTINFTVTPSGGQPVAGSFTIVVSTTVTTVTITPIPSQAAAVGQPFSLGLGQYVAAQKTKVYPKPPAAPLPLPSPQVIQPLLQSLPLPQGHR